MSFDPIVAMPFSVDALQDFEETLGYASNYKEEKGSSMDIWKIYTLNIVTQNLTRKFYF